jgi:hypothetical protein
MADIPSRKPPPQPPAPGAFHNYPKQYQQQPQPAGQQFPTPKPLTVTPTPAFKRVPMQPTIEPIPGVGRPYPVQKPSPPTPVPSQNRVPTQPRFLRPGTNLPAIFRALPGQRYSDLNREYLNKPAWRRKLRMASFKGQPFYVDQQGRTSGRRTVLHQYPKRDTPWSEDLGREAFHYAMTGYLLMAPNYPESDFYKQMKSNYDEARDDLEEALISGGPGTLIDPYNPRIGAGGLAGMRFMCEKYTITEARERGGYCTIEMSFVEYGSPGLLQSIVNTVYDVKTKSNAATQASVDWLTKLQLILMSRGEPKSIKEYEDMLRQLGIPVM